jgi:hypothetical protein
MQSNAGARGSVLDAGKGADPGAALQLGRNLARTSRQPLRRRERGAQRFGRQQTRERLAPVHASVFNHVNRDRDINRRAVFRANRAAALAD